MAENLLRLKVESQEYDSKIKRAAEGIQKLAAKIHDSQGEFQGLEDEQKEFIKNLQYMNTVSHTAVGKVRELETAYKGLQTMYNGFNGFEKNSEEGRILAEQLEILKQRTQQARQEMSDAEKSLNDFSNKSNEAGGVLDQLAQKFTINIDALKLFDVGMKAANVALDVAKDAFFANEQQLDAWGATVESAESLYQGFLNSLNNGDISGYLNSINEIVRAANSAYNALDALGTFNAFNQVNVEKARTNMTESIVDYREGKTDKNTVRAAGDAYKKELEDRRKLEQQAYIEAIGKVAAERGVNKQDLIDALSGSYGNYQDLKNIQPTGTVTKYSPGIMPGSQGSYTTYTVAQGRQEKLGEALRQLNDTELQSLQALGAQAQRTSNEIAQVDRQLVRVLNGRQGGSGGGGITPRAPRTTKVELTEEEKEAARQAKALAEAERKRAEQINKLNEEGVDAVRNNNLGQAIKVRSQAITAGYEGDTSIPVAFTYSQDNMSALMSMLKSDISASEIGSDMFNALTAQLNDATALSNLITYAMKGGIEASDLSEVSNALFQQLLGEGEIPDEALEAFKNAIGDSLGTALELGGDGSLKEGKKDDNKAWEGFQKSIGNLSTAMSGLTTVTSGLQALGIKIDGDFANLLTGIQGAISIVQGVISIINALSVPTETANTISTNLNTTAITAMTAALHSNTISRWIKPWAEGGVVHAAMGITVPGNNFSGDLVPAMVNSGELILNKAQQGNLLAQMEGGGMMNMHIEGIIAGEDIRLVLKNGALRRNESEYLNFNFS